MNDPRPRLCVVGSLNMDLVVRSPRLPAPGETLLGDAFSTSPGGKGANQAVAAARLGAAVSMVGAVGHDAHGAALLEVLAAERIDATFVRTDPCAPTGVALITVCGGERSDAGRGENTIVVAPGANATLTTTDVDRAACTITGADALLMQLECPLPAVIRAATLAQGHGVTVILNAAPAQRLPPDLLALVDVLVVNRVESEAVAPGRGADALPVETVIVTRGAEGATIHRHGAVRHVAAFPVRALDSVGAGDAFMGALATRWAEHQVASMLDDPGIADAMCWACAAGALATTRAGAVPSLPTRAEVASLLRRVEAAP